MSSKQVLANGDMTPTVNAAITRPLAEYDPDIWGDFFVNNMPKDEESIDYNEKRLKELNENVKRELLADDASKASQQLKLIEAIQRLGVGYLFQKEIEDILQHMYETHHDYEKTNCDNLYNVALWFRLLRQQGYNISCDIFNKFKDSGDDFSESLIKDTEGMLELYEAAYFRKNGEDLLEKAIDFTTTHLKQMEASLGNNLRAQVSHALKNPILKDMPRLRARRNIFIYEKTDSRNEALLELAKIDFNRLQSLHKKEIGITGRWWKAFDFKTNLPFARDRHVESYFWALAMYFEPQYSHARCILAKTIGVITLIDDTYDAYGTYEELVPFTKAIERWDISCIHELPTDHMKFVYRVLLHLYEEIDNEMTKQGRSYRSHYWREVMTRISLSYFQEAKWVREKYMPSMEEYLHNALGSGGCLLLTASSYVGMGDEVTKDDFEYICAFPKILRSLSVIGRIVNDIASHKFEQKREHFPSAVECYIKQYGVSEEHAYKDLRRQVEDAWKDVNEECLKPIPLSKPLLMPILALASSLEIIYEEGDEFTFVGDLLKGRIGGLLVDPVPM